MHPCDNGQLFLDSIHDNGKKAGLYKENLLLRGCTIRNTEAVVGIVIYAGRLGGLGVLGHCSLMVLFFS